MDERKINCFLLSVEMLRLSENTQGNSLDHGLLLGFAAIILTEDWVKISALEHLGKLLKEDLEEDGRLDDEAKESFLEFEDTIGKMKENL